MMAERPDDNAVHPPRRPKRGDLVTIRWRFGRPPDDPPHAITVGWVVGIGDEFVSVSPTMLGSEPIGPVTPIPWGAIADGWPRVVEAPEGRT